MPYFCLTIRKCTPCKTAKAIERTVAVYESYINRLKLNDPKLHLEYHYENVIKKNGGNNVHIHAMLKTPNVPHLVYKKGYSIKLEKCNSPQAWQAYITKSSITKQDILNIYNSVNTQQGSCSDECDCSEDELIDITEYPRLV